MRNLTAGRIALIAAAIAIVAYLPSLANSWALDDISVIERNARVHSIGAALEAFFAPYWPPVGDGSPGLYRPLIILSYAVDWTLSGGTPWFSHLMNVLWHAAATALVVLVAAAWLGGPALLVVGVVFALHPVHVEAVANVVGRAELMAAVLVLGAMLAARRGRDSVAVVLVAAALLTKESAIVALPLIWLDTWLGRRSQRVGLSLALGVVSLAWLHLWHAIAGAMVLDGVAAPLRNLGAGERLATMLPIVLEVVRLLTWPFRLAADYNPQMIVPTTTLTWAGALGVAVVTALLGLALALRRTAPAVTCGIVGGAIAWGPTANVLAPTGILLAERTLYLPSIAVALVAGVIAAGVLERFPGQGRLALAGALLLAGVWTVRVETRIPFWRDSRTVVIEDYLEHPENYRAHVRIGFVYAQTGDTARALREYLWAAELWPHDPVVTVQAGGAAMATGQVRVALREARRGWALAPGSPVTAERLAATLAWAGDREGALAVAAAGRARHAGSAALETRYAALRREIGIDPWWDDLLAGRMAWLEGRAQAATGRLRTAAIHVPDDPPRSACADLRDGAELARNLLVEGSDRLADASDAACSGN
jgi:hypothetical protein